MTVDDEGRLWVVGAELFKPIDLAPDQIGGPVGSGSYLVRWDDTEWTTLAEDVFSIESVTAIDGGVAVFGSFFSPPGLPGNGVAIWRDGVWSSLGVQNAQMIAGTRTTNGFCAVGNLQTVQAFIEGVACWNGSSWSQLGNPIFGARTIAQGKDGSWYLAGFMTLVDGGNERHGIARLDAGEWRALDGGVHAREVVKGGGNAFTPEVRSISVDGDGIVVAGHFEWVGVPKKRAFNLARWSPSSGWSAMTPATDLFGALSTVLATSERTYVGGNFVRIGLGAGAGIATVDGGMAHALPESTLASTRLGPINDMIALPEGIVVAGRFKESVDFGDPNSQRHSLLRFDGEWTAIEGVPVDSSMIAVALDDDGYAVRAGRELYRRFAGERWQLVTAEPVIGPLVADGNGTLFFVVDTVPQSTIVQSTRDDTSFYATVPGNVVAMAIHDGALVVVTTNNLGGQTVYRRNGDDWELIGGWADYTNSLVSSPALGLVAATQGGTRVWNEGAWRTISTATNFDMAACSDGVVAAIDEGQGSRLAFIDDPDGEWTYFGEPRGAHWWQIVPTDRGIYVGASFADGDFLSQDSPMGFGRWTTLDDNGW
jgi:hypothetical protein